MSQDRVLVTGSTGTIGTEVIKALVADGVPVRAAYNNPRSQAILEALGVTETVQLNMDNPASLDQAFQGVSRAFLLVPFVPQLVELGKTLIDAAKQSSVEYVVRLSAIGASPEATLLTGYWHGQLDAYLNESGLANTILQPNFFMQNFISFYSETIKRQNAIYLPYDDARVSWIDARDIGAVAATCLQNSATHTGKTYVLTGSEAPTTAEIAELFSQTLGSPIAYHDIPESTAIDAMKAQGTPEIIVQALAELNTLARSGQCSLLSPDVETVTGTKAMPFQQFIADHRSAWMG